MRNIYDIISEQKAKIDINICSYDLDYIIEAFNSNDFYIEEGLGETVKNIGVKIIEFIKKIVNKIKELVKRIINYLGVNKRTITLDQINDGLKNKDSNNQKTNDKSPQNDQNVYDKNIHKGKNNVTDKDILAGSLRSVSIIKFANFKVKESVTNTFLGAVNGVVGNHLDTFFADKYEDENKQLLKAVKRGCFKGNGSYKTNKEASLADRIVLEIGEPKEPTTVKVKDIPIDVFSSYIDVDANHGGNGDERGKGIKKFLMDSEKYSTDLLLKFKNKLEEARNSGNKINDVNFAQIQQIVSMVGTFMNIMTTNIFNAYNTLIKIFDQACNDFCKAYNVNIQK